MIRSTARLTPLATLPPIDRQAFLLHSAPPWSVAHRVELPPHHPATMPYQLRRWEGVHNEAVDRRAILCLKILLLVAVPTVLTR